MAPQVPIQDVLLRLFPLCIIPLCDVSDFHVAKIGDPTRVMSGELVFAEEGILLPPIGQMQFELWHQLNIQKVRETVGEVLSDFAAKWEAKK